MHKLEKLIIGLENTCGTGETLAKSSQQQRVRESCGDNLCESPKSF